MRPAKQSDSGETQRLGPRLDQIVDLNHPLVNLGSRLLDTRLRNTPIHRPVKTRVRGHQAFAERRRARKAKFVSYVCLDKA